MIEIRGNIWNLAGPNDLICITTNGFVKRDGSCVMGRGIALEAKNKYPRIEYQLGELINLHGNCVQFINDRIIAFPVKPEEAFANENKSNIVSHMRNKFEVGHIVPGWACKADIEIIEQSCLQLRGVLSTDRRNVYIPRPGCGAGELEWNNHVQSICENILHLDKFKVCTF